MQLVDGKIKITKINGRSNPEMLSFSQLFKTPSHSKNINPCHETVTAQIFRRIFLCYNADGVGFETIRYYLIINTIKDLYCAVLKEIATTCNYAVTNCHGNHFTHSQSKILPESPSPFDKKLKNSNIMLLD